MTCKRENAMGVIKSIIWIIKQIDFTSNNIKHNQNDDILCKRHGTESFGILELFLKPSAHIEPEI